MSYSKDHNENQCDRCLREVGRTNLSDVPFLYLDRQDHTHPDYDKRKGYKAYKVCSSCLRRLKLAVD